MKKFALIVFVISTLILFNLPIIIHSSTRILDPETGVILFHERIFSSGLALFSINLLSALIFVFYKENKEVE